MEASSESSTSNRPIQGGSRSKTNLSIDQAKGDNGRGTVIGIESLDVAGEEKGGGAQYGEGRLVSLPREDDEADSQTLGSNPNPPRSSKSEAGNSGVHLKPSSPGETGDLMPDLGLKKLHCILGLKVKLNDLEQAGGIKSIAGLDYVSFETLKSMTKKMKIDLDAMKKSAPYFVARIEGYLAELTDSEATKLKQDINNREVDVPLLTLVDTNQIIFYQRWQHKQDESNTCIPTTAQLNKFASEILAADLETVLKGLQIEEYWGDAIKGAGIGSLADFSDTPIEWYKKKFCSTHTADGEGGKKFMNDSHIESIKKFMDWRVCKGILFLPNDWRQSYYHFCNDYKFKESEVNFHLKLHELGLSHDDIAMIRAQNVMTEFEFIQASEHWRLSDKDVTLVKSRFDSSDEVTNIKRLVAACGWLPLSVHASELLIKFRASEVAEKEKSLFSERSNKISAELKQTKRVIRYTFGAFLAYLLLTCWILTTVYFIVATQVSGCHGVNGHGIVFDFTDSTLRGTKKDPDDEKFLSCMVLYSGLAAGVHSVIFGLVTAVVIHELSEASESKRSLYNRFSDLYLDQITQIRQGRRDANDQQRRVPLRRVRLRQLYQFLILQSTRAYMFSWIVCGAASMIYGFASDTLPSNPVYVTGLTWLGVAITLAFAFFGVEGDGAPSVDDARKKINQDTKNSVDGLLRGRSAEGDIETGNAVATSAPATSS